MNLSKNTIKRMISSAINNDTIKFHFEKRMVENGKNRTKLQRVAKMRGYENVRNLGIVGKHSNFCLIRRKKDFPKAAQKLIQFFQL